MRCAENLAAQMAPQDEGSVPLQGMEDLYLRRLWCLINAMEKLRQGGLPGERKKFGFEAGMCMKTKETKTK